jgi:hypothetical protein
MRISALLFTCASFMLAADWSAPVDVLHEMKPSVTYRARVNGDTLLIQALLQPGWHTFTMDNERRAAEKLAGKPSLGIDQPTQIKLSKGLEATGGWYQSPPKDFSKPDLRWFSWGFEQQAMFAAKVRQSGTGPAHIEIRGQACTDTTCKNIDVSLVVPLEGPEKTSPAIDLKTLVPVR